MNWQIIGIAVTVAIALLGVAVAAGVIQSEVSILREDMQHLITEFLEHIREHP